MCSWGLKQVLNEIIPTVSEIPKSKKVLKQIEILKSS